MRRFLTYIFLLATLASCSQYSKKPASVAFHNINAKYNALWQAERVEKELIKKIQDDQKENYRNLLPIFYFPPAQLAANYKSDVDKIIKKASLVIDRHQNSHFIDDAYLMIGKGRVYQADWKNAIETFKYVNSIDPDETRQITSLLDLFKVYIQTNEFQEADRVNEFLLSFDLNKTQKKDFYLLKAWYSQKKQEPLQMIALLEEALPLINNTSEKARILYILGQVNFLQNREAQAISYFQRVSENKSNYDLAFQAKLAIYQIKDNEAEILKMLKEGKNEEYKPFLYVALGQIYYQKNDFNQAKYYWELGAKNADQKGELFLQLGHLFAKQFRKPKEATIYYDSAMVYLNNSHPEYQEIKTSSDKWKKFGGLLDEVHLNDSLLTLSTKSDAELIQIYTKAIASKIQKNDSSRVNSIKKIEIPQINFVRRQSTPEQQSFYFYNDLVRIRGEQEFIGKYGSRILEDFWNRKTKNNIINTSETSSTKGQNTSLPNNELVLTNKNQGKDSAKDSSTIWLESIPRTPKEIALTQKKIEKSIFESGKFAKFDLEDNTLAKEQLQVLLKRFPQTEFEAETLYLLYLSEVNEPKEREVFKKALIEKYPESHFKTLLIKNETGTLSDNKELEAQKLYEKAFNLFKEGQFEESFRICINLDNQYPGSHLEDKIVFLKALNKGALKDFSAYENFLNLIVQSFPKSKLKAEAEARLKTIKNR